MYKAALLLGVGGTGRWALTHVRARLLGSVGAAQDERQDTLGSVYLLGFDVDQKNTYEFSGHRLESSELHLSTPGIGAVITNLCDFSDDHPRARYHQFREWMSQADAKSYDLALLNEYLEDGSGQMRQWGRLAVLLQTEFFTRVRDIVGELAKRGSIEVYVVGSLCGGTGSAAFFDAAMTVHAVHQKVAPGVPIRMIGAFALPAGFGKDVRQKEFAWLEACSFAAMRELDRFQRAPSTVRITTEGDVLGLKNRLFDVCYLIDGIREDGRAGGQALINSPARHGIHAALADLLYSHLHPGSSGPLDSRYVNVATHLGGSHTYKFSKFGTYSVVVPDKLILRSLALEDAQAVIEALLAPAEGEIASLAATPHVIFDDEAGNNRKAFNAKVFGTVERYLGQRRRERAPRVSEILEWLTPADWDNAKQRLPRRPDFLRDFPDITRLRTPYPNREVKERVDSRVTSYIHEVRRFTDQSRPVILRSFRLCLLAQAVRIASNPTSRGGLARSRVALLKMAEEARELRQRLQQLFETRAGKRGQASEAYNNAQESMGRNRRWDDALQQRGLFEAADRHLEAEVEAAASAALDNLLDNVLNTINDVLSSEVQGWERALQRLANDLKEATTDALDRCWNEQQSILVRRVVPERHSRLEERLRRHIVETLRQRTPDTAIDVESHAEPLVRAVHWVVGFDQERGKDTMKIAGLLPAESLQLTDLLAHLEQQYASAADIGIGDVLDLASSDSPTFISDLAAEIKAKSTLLASGAPEPTASPAQLPIPHTFLFGPWGSSQRSIRELRQALIDQGFNEADFNDTLMIATSNPAGVIGVPLKQAIWVLRTYHGVSLAGYGTTEALEDRYLQLRNGKKPLHIFPEERAASEKEAKIHALARAGRLHSHVHLLDTQAVLLAGHERLMRNILLLVIAKKLTWKFDHLEQSGQWMLRTNGQDYMVAHGSQPEILLDALVQLALADTDPLGGPAKIALQEAVDKAAREVTYPYLPHVTARLKMLINDGSSGVLPLNLDPANELLVRVLAFELLPEDHPRGNPHGPYRAL